MALAVQEDLEAVQETAQVVETTPVEPVKEDIQRVPEDIQHEDFASEANIALPKTGQAPNQSALVFFSSALLLLDYIDFQEKRRLIKKLMIFRSLWGW